MFFAAALNPNGTNAVQPLIALSPTVSERLARATGLPSIVWTLGANILGALIILLAGFRKPPRPE